MIQIFPHICNYDIDKKWFHLSECQAFRDPGQYIQACKSHALSAYNTILQNQYKSTFLFIYIQKRQKAIGTLSNIPINFYFLKNSMLGNPV